MSSIRLPSPRREHTPLPARRTSGQVEPTAPMPRRGAPPDRGRPRSGCRRAAAEPGGGRRDRAVARLNGPRSQAWPVVRHARLGYPGLRVRP
jgi:hypothetical protein